MFDLSFLFEDHKSPIISRETIEKLTDTVLTRRYLANMDARGGCVEYQKKYSLERPKEVIAQTVAYRKEQDTIGLFMEDCVVEDPDVRTPATVVYSKYVEWCGIAGYNKVDHVTFGKMLRSIVAKKGRSGGGKWYGLKITYTDLHENM